MPSDLNAPGLIKRPNADGSLRYYWGASKSAIKAGYRPRIVRIHAPDGDLDFIETRCQELQAQMLALLNTTERAFDGTLGALIDMYERHDESPYRALRSKTRRTYAGDLKKIRAAAGAAVLARMAATDFRRWYKAALGQDGKHVRSAHGLMVMLRILMGYGVVEGIPHADRLRGILSGMRFTSPAARTVRPTYAQARAVFDKAVELGAYSLAFGTALQFDGMLRQYDVTGVWEEMDPDEKAAVVRDGKRWAGPVWGNIVDGVFRWTTGKKGRPVEIDLTAYPMIVEAMKLVPAGLPSAPLIVDERSGLPYAEGSYGRRWREIADAAGLPKEIFNRDFRAGGVSEAEDAGAVMTDIAKQAAHADPNFTARVYGRGFLKASGRVAESRVKHRENKP